MTDPIVILLVEDEAAHVEAIRRAFEAAGAETELQVAGSLREYRAAVAARPPDLALIDLNLPDGRALEVLTSPPAASPFPILIMTCYGNEQVAVEALKAGALDYLVKSPEAFADMPLTVACALGQWNLLRERQRAAEALRESEQRYRTLIETAPVVIYTLGADDGRITSLNPAFEIVTGWSPKEWIGKAFAPLVHPEDRPLAAETFQQVLRGEHPPAHELRILAKSGECLIGEFMSAPQFERGNVVGEFGVVRDITERKQAEDRMRMFSQDILAAREQERKQVSSALHHDVGSLAVGISAHLDAIEAELRSGKVGEALNWMKRIRKLFGESVVRLKGLAVQLRPPELDVLGLRAALRQHFAQVTERGGVRIHFRENLGRRRVSGDTATILFRVAQEALTNALTHGHATRVDVGLSASKKEVRLTVRNNGKGFDPSEPGARATSRMGLRVMREMVAAAEGAFTIDSGRGKRTTVRVRLPLADCGLRIAECGLKEMTT